MQFPFESECVSLNMLKVLVGTYSFVEKRSKYKIGLGKKSGMLYLNNEKGKPPHTKRETKIGYTQGRIEKGQFQRPQPQKPSN